MRKLLHKKDKIGTFFEGRKVVKKSGENFYSLEYHWVMKVFLRILLLGIRIASKHVCVCRTAIY
jgi:hypothetical protein